MHLTPQSSHPFLGRVFVWILMAPVIAMLPLVACTGPLLIPAGIFAQIRAAAYGVDKDHRWGIRLAAGFVYGLIQLGIVSAVLKRFGVVTMSKAAVLGLCLPIILITVVGFYALSPAWAAAGRRIMAMLRFLYGVKRNEELPCQRLLEAAEWVFFLELPALVGLVAAVVLTQLSEP